MPFTEVYFYKDDDESVSVLDWLVKLHDKNRPAARIAKYKQHPNSTSICL